MTKMSWSGFLQRAVSLLIAVYPITNWTNSWRRLIDYSSRPSPDCGFTSKEDKSSLRSFRGQNGVDLDVSFARRFLVEHRTEGSSDTWTGQKTIQTGKRQLASPLQVGLVLEILSSCEDLYRPQQIQPQRRIERKTILVCCLQLDFMWRWWSTTHQISNG